MLRRLSAAALFVALAAAPAIAQQGAPRPPPPVASKDPAAAAAGAYKMDTNHTSVVARIGHANGFSFSTFRFGKVTGDLTWDPAKVENSKVSITLDLKSIASPVAGFAEELNGANFLNTAEFPEAKFVSTSIRRTGPTKGQITGNLTWRGVTKPVVIDAEMVGAGKGMRAVVVGFTGTAHFKRSDFGYSAAIPMIGDDVELLIDTEFDQA